MPRKNKTIKHHSLPTEKFLCDKKRYKNEKDALDAAKNQTLEKMSLELSVYKCDLCGYWHLTRSVNI